ncbi:MAG: MBL fold metallo-hydrolase [Aquabacterium sp.]|uniref:MBL fold metallo-hydrolase n=1 Tax=Aquabacterium sp. TaxID=1872578 RepID=UPI00271E0098|nr:MBL fold metallo-hydrolase [Aquabacterium sp.]MDO9002601.1 MBL fold metallo-hydrolase [Aquabacterium sp.]
MFKYLLPSILALASMFAHAQSKAGVEFAIVKTGKTTTLKGMMVSGGGFTTKVDGNFSAILVKHGQTHFLFDSGLGTQVAQQYQQDMPWWARAFFKYEDPVVPARTQLDQAGIPPIDRIFLSHAHWDHASGLGDFPEAVVWAAPEELHVVAHAAPGLGGSWPSQVSLKSIRWQALDFKPQPYKGFDRSIDVFSDGSVVLVPMFGHTPGSIGMFVTVASGKRFFFCGDAVWRADALKDGSPKFWPASLIVDKDREQTQHTIEQMRELVRQDPGLVVVPAHDDTVQAGLGYFPLWVK